ncbi:MAG: hypothetical protein RMM10_09205, partial [Anaerolineae bacterium]|uniref:hypothetical protein n=1 Tax=Thermoflexus sp. TaxID=1969742 RepID=UPI0025EE9E0E
HTDVEIPNDERIFHCLPSSWIDLQDNTDRVASCLDLLFTPGGFFPAVRGATGEGGSAKGGPTLSPAARFLLTCTSGWIQALSYHGYLCLSIFFIKI